MTGPSPTVTESAQAPQQAARSTNTAKARLTANRARRVVENDDYGTFARRVLAAYGRRATRGDGEVLARMTTFAAELDEAISQA